MLTCPHCHSNKKIWKKGRYTRPADRLIIQRFLCVICGKKFSDRSFAIDLRHRKRHLNQMAFRLLAKGVSQRATAFLLQIKPEAVARRVKRFGLISRAHLEHYRLTREKASVVLFDEMESFEHTNMKPLTIPIAVEFETRKVLALELGQIAAKGPLAEASRAKYGERPCERRELLYSLLYSLKECCKPNVTIRTDCSKHYGKKIKEVFPEAEHETHLGRRSAVVGQGEMKCGDFDPLFSLNHTYAMFRDNVKTLSRRTWCIYGPAQLARKNF